jgi:hypothetical protein
MKNIFRLTDADKTVFPNPLTMAIYDDAVQLYRISMIDDISNEEILTKHCKIVKIRDGVTITIPDIIQNIDLFYFFSKYFDTKDDNNILSHIFFTASGICCEYILKHKKQFKDEIISMKNMADTNLLPQIEVDTEGGITTSYYKNAA